MRTEKYKKIVGVLKEILGSEEVYFQAPENTKMTYPAITFKLTDIDVVHASNKKYRRMDEYTITILDKNPISNIKDGVLELPYSSLTQRYNIDGLYHDIITLYY